MTKFSTLYAQALSTLKSNTIAAMTDVQIESYFNDLAIRAVAAFRFPQISLTYTNADDGNGNLTYTFDNEVTQREVNVLLVLIKHYWLQQQIDNEELFETLYYDRDVKTFSRGNMMSSLKGRYELSKKEVKTAQYNYGRVATDGSSGLGNIYKDE